MEVHLQPAIFNHGNVLPLQNSLNVDKLTCCAVSHVSAAAELIVRLCLLRDRGMPTIAATIAELARKQTTLKDVQSNAARLC